MWLPCEVASSRPVSGAKVEVPPLSGQRGQRIAKRQVQVHGTRGRPYRAIDRVLSIRFILPITVTLIVSAMAATTICLMAANTEAAVDNVVQSLQDQVSAIVQNRI